MTNFVKFALGGLKSRSDLKSKEIFKTSDHKNTYRSNWFDFFSKVRDAFYRNIFKRGRIYVTLRHTFPK